MKLPFDIYITKHSWKTEKESETDFVIRRVRIVQDSENPKITHYLRDRFSFMFYIDIDNININDSCWGFITESGIMIYGWLSSIAHKFWGTNTVV
jgi:hypothetical protein